MAITQPAVNASSYLDADDENATPKVGTTVQAGGWDAATKILKTAVKDGEYPNDFKFTEESQLIKFIGDGPFRSYEQHWIDRSSGKRSFVCIADSDAQGCPLCDLLGDKPRGKFAFTVLVLSADEPKTMIMTAPPTLFRQIKAANEDPKRGPLNKFYYSISRMGTGPQTTYSLERVRSTDLQEDWDLDSAQVEELVAQAEQFSPEVIWDTPRSELLEIARSVA
jgi:hypothetical protein